VVTPSVGPTVIIGLGMESANDAPERDPKHVTLEGSNDDAPTWTTGNWSLIADLQADYFTNRYQWQYLYFQNQLPFKHYRWTVLQTATNNSCCMQVAEVQLLAVTAKADCNKAAFVSLPTDMPVLPGSQATFFSEVNGPWPLQWASNGVPISGATKPTFTTVPITTANAGAAYTLSIVGCQTSAPVHAVVFTPSTIQSVGIHFVGGGANGAPTSILTNDIVGQQLQAFWNNAQNVGSGFSDGTNAPSPLLDSSNNPTTITFSWSTSGTWGAGVGSDQPVQRLLNGIVGTGEAGDNTSNPTGFINLMTFSNVPPGTHSLLVYAIGPPLQFQTVAYSVTNQGTPIAYYMRVMNSDEYKKSPGFYRAVSTNPSAPDIADFLRFENLKPNADGTITLAFQLLTTPDATTRRTGVNAIQLLLNAGSVGNPPVITQQPQPTVAPAGYPATLTVVATGTGLTYEWRKGGAQLFDGPNISGASTPTLTILSLGPADEGIYSVTVKNLAGTTVSKNAVVSISNYNISDSLVNYWKFDETSGTNAANSAAGGLPITFSGSFLTSPWGSGLVGNAFTFNGSDNYGFVSNYTKASKQISGQVWVTFPQFGYIPASSIFKNAAPELTTSGGTTTTHGQFSFNLTKDPATGNALVQALIGLGPNIATANGTNSFTPDAAWHHLAFTADGAQLRLYVDGKPDVAVDYLGDINPPDIPWIAVGANLVVDTTSPPAIPDPAGALFFGNGSVDEMALWTRALTPAEIGLLYQAGKTGKELTSIVEPRPSAPAGLSAKIIGGDMIVSWTPAGGHLEATPTLSPATWMTISTNNPSTNALSGIPQRFFRVVNP